MGKEQEHTPIHEHEAGTYESNHEPFTDSTAADDETPGEDKRLQEPDKRAARLLVGATVDHGGEFFEEILESSLDADIRLGITPVGGIAEPELRLGPQLSIYSQSTRISGAEEIKRFLKNLGSVMGANQDGSRGFLEQTKEHEKTQSSNFSEGSAEEL